MNVLKVEHLQKNFGADTVLKDVNFAVAENKIFGFLGENGAGKTTTMHMILGLLPKDAGEMTVCDEQVKFGETATNRFIGYLPDVPAFYDEMNAVEYLKFCGEITEMNRKTCAKKIDELLAVVALAKAKKKRIGGYSRGMKQRLGIAQALLNEPKLLICDEPTSALDPVGRKEMLDLLLSVKKYTTIVFSTHILSDAEQICDEVAILHNGEIVVTGELETVKKQFGQEKLQITFKDEKVAQDFVESIQNKNWQVMQDEQNVTLMFEDMETLMTESFAILATHNWVPEKFERCMQSLEDIFMEVVK